MNILGYFHGIDPAAALVMNGELVALVEEERLVRFKHAANIFPVRAMETCLDRAKLKLSDIDCFAIGWDAPRYSNGEMARFYDTLNASDPPDVATRAWQVRLLATFHVDNQRRQLVDQLVRHFGISPEDVPPSRFFPHHEAHAAAAFYLSPYNTALVVSIDGSGDDDTTTVWRGDGTTLTPLHRVKIPHSLGWFYAAITEFLGFEAYDGEYKVMGLAAYGRPNEGLRRKLAQIVKPGPKGWDFVVDPKYIHRGAHTFSSRFTDAMVDLIAMPPRLGPKKIEAAHEELAFEAQYLLEETVTRLVAHWQKETGLRHLCVGGGVALNVKMNSRILKSGLFDDVFAFPVPSDTGLSVGAALGIEMIPRLQRPEPLPHLYLGPSFYDDDIERQLRSCGFAYECPENLAEAVAELLAEKKIVGWFQTGMEAGPRALGARSIIADPRDVAARDRVNAAIKFREYWRPFCPSLTEEDAPRFFKLPRPAPHMILAFDATDEAKRTVPAVVHVDGTMRVQTVNRATNPRFYDMLKAFEKRSGVPCVLNTSFNVKGEAVVCTPRDAFRTFWSTGIDALAIGSFLIRKPVAPEAMQPEDANR